MLIRFNQKAFRSGVYDILSLRPWQRFIDWLTLRDYDDAKVEATRRVREMVGRD